MIKRTLFLVISIIFSGVANATPVDKVGQHSGDSDQVTLSGKQLDSLMTWIQAQHQRNDVYAREIYVLRKEMKIMADTIGYMAAQIGIAGKNSELGLKIVQNQKEKHDAFVKDFFERVDKWGDSADLEVYKILRDSPYGD